MGSRKGSPQAGRMVLAQGAAKVEALNLEADSFDFEDEIIIFFDTWDNFLINFYLLQLLVYFPTFACFN